MEMVFLNLFLVLFHLVLAEDNLDIVYGSDADIADYPWTVAIFADCQEFICAGSLISPDWVLSAAHCALEPLKTIRAGSSELISNQGVVVDIAGILVHPNFTFQDDGTVIYDFLLLYLVTPVIGNNIASIGLPELNQPFPEEEYVSITGWGQTDSFDPSKVLKQAIVFVTSLAECQKIHRQFNYSIVENLEFCTIKIDEMNRLCVGDTGGAAVIDGVAVGVTSFGNDACSYYKLQGIPVVYGNVASVRDWIKKITEI